MIPPDQHAPFPIGSTRVLALGDCNLFGTHVAPKGSSILDKFCRCLEQAGYRVSGQNLACRRACSRDGTALMASSKIQADILLLNYGHVDSRITPIARGTYPYITEVGLKTTSRKLLNLKKFRSGNLSPRRVVSGEPLVPLADFCSNIQRMIKFARKANPGVWILLWGSPPLQHNAQHNEQLLRYNAESHDIATRMGATYLPTKPVIDNLSFSEALRGKQRLSEVATTSIAAEMAHAYLSQRQRTAA